MQEYTYRLQNLSPDGSATVEYKHPDLGNITRHMILPYDKGEAACRQKILEEFPWQRFYSNRLRNSTAKMPGLLEGTFRMDLDDFVYDFAVMCGEASTDQD